MFWCGLLFLCDKFTKTQDFCFLLAWSLKCVLACSLLVLCVLVCHYLCACFGVVITVYFAVIIYLIPLIDRRGHLFNSSERFSLDLYDNFMKTCVLSFGVVFEVHFGVVSHLIMCVFVWFFIMCIFVVIILCGTLNYHVFWALREFCYFDR